MLIYLKMYILLYIIQRSWMMERPTQRMTVWAKIYRREFLQKNHLYFNTGLWVSEDSEFLVRCMKKCRYACVSRKIIYSNQLYGASVTRSVAEGRIAGHLQALRTVQDEVPEDKEFRNYVLAHVNLISVHEIFDPAIRQPWRERIKKLRRFLREEPVRSQIEKVRFPAGIHLLPSFLFKHGLYSIGGLICYMRAVKNRKAYTK